MLIADFCFLFVINFLSLNELSLLQGPLNCWHLALLVVVCHLNCDNNYDFDMHPTVTCEVPFVDQGNVTNGCFEALRVSEAFPKQPT